MKPFAQQGEWTPIQNYAFDVLMPILPPNAWKVLCFIIRKTEGWHKPAERLSYTAIQQGTGIKHSATLTTALGVLFDKKLITATSGDKWEARSYAFNRDYDTASERADHAPSTSKNEVGEDELLRPQSTSKIEVNATSKSEVILASKNDVVLTSKIEVFKRNGNQALKKQNKETPAPRSRAVGGGGGGTEPDKGTGRPVRNGNGTGQPAARASPIPELTPEEAQARRVFARMGLEFPR